MMFCRRESWKWKKRRGKQKKEDSFVEKVNDDDDCNNIETNVFKFACLLSLLMDLMS